MLSFEGIPGIYFNSLFGTSNDEAKYIITGNNRDINRYRWSKKNILTLLQDKKSKQNIFYNEMTNLIKIRRKQKAFHPNAKRLTLNISSKIFCFKRISADKKQTIISITNLSSETQYPKLDQKYTSWKNLLNPQTKLEKKNLFRLEPFESKWLSNI